MKKIHLVVSSLVGGGALALTSMAYTQTAQNTDTSDQLSEVTVTGSRVITNGNDSPNPVTVMTTQDLAVTKPTTVFEGLQELPQFAGGTGGQVAGSTGQGGTNNSAAVLNLRGLGPTRVLILYDGHRVPPQNLSGTIDLNQIPQMLLQRVDIETGGSSAVYGSDAITGVVNFITDTHFNGIKANLQGGISQLGDDDSHELGIAAGHDLFGGRGHLEGSYQEHYDEGLLRSQRPSVQPPGAAQWTLAGQGTTASPYFLSNNVRDPTGTFGGIILGKNPLLNDEFVSNGVLAPYTAGIAVPGVSNQQIGGDGGYAGEKVSLKAPLDFNQLYGRFDFDVSDNVHYFLTSFYDIEHQFSYLANSRTTSLSGSGLVFNVTDPYLPTVYTTQMQAAGLTTFNVGKYWDTNNIPASNTDYHNHNFYLNTGLNGKLGEYKWEASYTASEAVQADTANNTLSTGRLLAALDAVPGPNGTPVCEVSLTQYAGLYPGCVPMNVFGPTATTAAMWNYALQPTRYVGTTKMNDAEGSITGAPFNTWAGPVTTAISAEWRWLAYQLTSGAPPPNIQPLDCTGLRYNCTAGTTTLFFSNGTAARDPVWQTVKEGALETDVPLVKDVPFAQALNVNAAARYAGYTATGSPIVTQPYAAHTFSADTFKVGLDWHLNDEITVRATRSRDFRAPNLNDLFSPARIQALVGFNDLLTKSTYATQQFSGGNATLQPEVGYTSTLGLVVKPLPNLSFSLDAFQINMQNAITSLNGSGTNFQTACDASGGSSPYCSLIARPLGYTNTTAANQASLVYTSLSINLADVKTQGLDFEGNYSTQLFDHPFRVRALGTFQPHIWTIQADQPISDAAGVSDPRLRWTVFLGYSPVENWTVDWDTRWRSRLENADPRLFVVAVGSLIVAPVAFSDLNITYHMHVLGDDDVYLNVQNVFNQIPPVYAPVASPSPSSSAAGSNGVGFYPADDIVGRSFLLGIRFKL